MSDQRQEMIEKGKTVFRSKSMSSDEINLWKESSLKYQAKYQESVQINQEIKQLLESCLAAKEALIKDLAAANEVIFQKDLKRDSRHCVYASKATQTLAFAESTETQTERENDAATLSKNAPNPVLDTGVMAVPVSTQTDNVMANASENVDITKNQLAHVRDAYERAQSQMQMLGNANAQLKADLENEKKISALLEGKYIFFIIIAEVNTLPDYIQKYHTERKTLLEKLAFEREKVFTLTERIQQLSTSENVEKLINTTKNESIESAKTPSPLTPVFKKESNLSENVLPATKEQIVLSPVSSPEKDSPHKPSISNESSIKPVSKTTKTSPLHSLHKEVSPKEDMPPKENAVGNQDQSKKNLDNFIVNQDQSKKNVDNVIVESKKNVDAAVGNQDQSKKNLDNVIVESKKNVDTAVVNQDQSKKNVDNVVVESKRNVDTAVGNQHQSKKNVDNVVVESKRNVDAALGSQDQSKKNVDNVVVESKRNVDAAVVNPDQHQEELLVKAQEAQIIPKETGHHAQLTIETLSKTKNVVTPLTSPDIKSVSSIPKDAEILSSATDNIPLALLYGQSICYNCQYYKDIKL
jgi:hypothetical protein